MLKRTLLVALVAGLAGVLGCSNEAEMLRRQNRSLTARLQTAQEECDHYAAAVADLQGNYETLAGQLAGAQSEKARMSDVVAKLQQEQARLEQQRGELRRLVQDLSGISVESRSEGNFIVLENAILFESGKADLSEDARRSLTQVADYLAGKPGLPIRIDGHSDGVPITVSEWKDNYHLSAMRAHAVMAYLISQGVAADRMFITGRGPNSPREEPEIPTAPMEANRRVEILLMPSEARSISDILAGFEQ